jgi:hypothetical protein
MRSETSNEHVGQTQALLPGGMVAGPLYLFAGLLHAAFRPGVDISRHALRLLSNGDLGWIQVANFINYRRPAHRGRSWGETGRAIGPRQHVGPALARPSWPRHDRCRHLCA